ncbi:Partitioning defective 3 B [Cichlidogyrus casuarinus]|uniref:Partitioning defective 3 B n=1 Tax=Cichlidogyrus casuarinus TaxID=1844966 RepID=A0ABD2QG54_9PLAT
MNRASRSRRSVGNTGGSLQDWLLDQADKEYFECQKRDFTSYMTNYATVRSQKNARQKNEALKDDSLSQSRAGSPCLYRKRNAIKSAKLPVSHPISIQITTPVSLAQHGFSLKPYFSSTNDDCIGAVINSAPNAIPVQTSIDLQLNDRIISIDGSRLMFAIHRTLPQYCSKENHHPRNRRKTIGFTSLRSPTKDSKPLVTSIDQIFDKNAQPRSRVIRPNVVPAEEQDLSAEARDVLTPVLSPGSTVRLPRDNSNPNFVKNHRRLLSDPADETSNSQFHQSSFHSSTSLRRMKGLGRASLGAGLGISLAPPIDLSQVSNGSSRKSSKSNLKEVNAFNTRAIGQTIPISLKKPTVGGLGFKISTRDTAVNDIEEPVFITCILPDGPAIEDGRLQIGDRILTINGLQAKGISETTDRLKSIKPGEEVELVISRQLQVLSSAEEGENVSGNVSDCEKQIGFKLSWREQQASDSKEGVYIENVLPNSMLCTEHMSGKSDSFLMPGDRLVGLNETSFEGMKMDQVRQCFKAAISDAKSKISRSSYPISVSLIIKVVRPSLDFLSPSASNKYFNRGGSSRRLSDKELYSNSQPQMLPRLPVDGEDDSDIDSDPPDPSTFDRQGLGRRSVSSKRRALDSNEPAHPMIEGYSADVRVS